MSQEQIIAVAERAMSRPLSPPWELHELHVPFDILSDSHSHEAGPQRRKTRTRCS